MTVLGADTGASQGLVAAQQRAMPLTRLWDGGMEPADAFRLFARTSGGEPWDQAAEGIAEEWVERGREAQGAGRRVTALQAYRYAAASLVFAQMAFNQDDDRKRELYIRLVEALDEVLALADPSIERIRPSFGRGRLSGWLIRPDAQAITGTVIVLGGLSGWGAAYLPIADGLTARGLAALLVEGPGQGEPRLRDGIYLGTDVDRGYSRFVDEVAARADLGGPVGIWGNSFGGLFAALTAARDDRLGACCVNGAPAAPVLPSFRTAREQILAAIGTEDPVQAARVLDDLHFDPKKDRIRCPVLVTHGGKDPIATLEGQQPFIDAGPTGATTLKVWDDGEHTIYNHSAERTAFVSDWFAGRLAGQRR